MTPRYDYVLADETPGAVKLRLTTFLGEAAPLGRGYRSRRDAERAAARVEKHCVSRYGRMPTLVVKRRDLPRRAVAKTPAATPAQQMRDALRGVDGVAFHAGRSLRCTVVSARVRWGSADLKVRLKGAPPKATIWIRAYNFTPAAFAPGGN